MKISVMKGSAGLFTQNDPTRSYYRKDPSPYTGTTGIDVFSACMNIDIDDRFRPSRRRAIRKHVDENAHSVFPINEKYCLFGAGNGLYLIRAGFTTYFQIAAVTPGRVSCVVVDDVAYWVNGAQKGKIVDGTNGPWEKPDVVVSDNVTRKFFSPPIGQRLAHYKGRIYVGDGKTLWYSEPFGYDIFAFEDSFLSLESPHTMIRPVAGGIYVSDGERTHFLAGPGPQEFVWKVVDDHPALPFSDQTAVGAFYDGKWVSGGKNEVAFWLTNNGIMYGDGEGNVSNISDEKIDLISTSASGAILVDGSTLIAQFN